MTDDTETGGDMNFLKLLNRIRFGKCCIPEGKKLVLTVASKELDAANVTEEDVQWLEQQLEVAYYSQDNVKTTDATVRNSKFTKAFYLNFDVNEIIGNMQITGYSKPYKLNLYKKGCFFAKHRDTNRPGLLGTLILILPTEYTGGELSFEGFNVDAYELHKEGPKPPKSPRLLDRNSLRFVYFDTDLEHSVSEVTSGYRISLVYNIFEDEKSAGEFTPIVDLSPIPDEWYDKLLDHAVKFCTGKKNILLGCFKYRNDVYQKLLKALKEKFDVIDVAVGDCETFGHMEEIKEVHVVNEDAADDIDFDCSPVFDDYIEKTYPVEHVLFPSNCEMDEDKIDYNISSGNRGNSPFDAEGEVAYFTGSLINPAKKE